jgi:pyruvate/2-oxoglutarate/acetoin dehydrogenase E1 component
MSEISKQKNSVFIGQQIVYYGNPMSKTVVGIAIDKMIETPVFEETQMGMSLGLAMTGKFVVSFYPRWDFLILALNQLINHIDKYKHMTDDDLHMIIRVGKGSDKPLDPGYQHKGNYFNQIKDMCININFMNCESILDIKNNYETAIKNKGIYLINEYPSLYVSTT